MPRRALSGCGKVTWAGCGDHVDQALAGFAAEDLSGAPTAPPRSAERLGALPQPLSARRTGSVTRLAAAPVRRRWRQSGAEGATQSLSARSRAASPLAPRTVSVALTNANVAKPAAVAAAMIGELDDVDGRHEPGGHQRLDVAEPDRAQHDVLRQRSGCDARHRGAAENRQELPGHRGDHHSARYADHPHRRRVAAARRQLDGGGDEEPGHGHQQHENGGDGVEPQGQRIGTLVEDALLLGEGPADAEPRSVSCAFSAAGVSASTAT